MPQSFMCMKFIDFEILSRNVKRVAITKQNKDNWAQFCQNLQSKRWKILHFIWTKRLNYSEEMKIPLNTLDMDTILY